MIINHSFYHRISVEFVLQLAHNSSDEKKGIVSNIDLE